MIVLGLNAFGHDAAAVLLVDGEVVFAASEERYDRCRHSPAFPTGAIQAALEAANIEPAAVDALAFPWSRAMGRRQKLGHVLRRLPRSMAFFRSPPEASDLPDRRNYLRAMRGLEARLRAEGFRAPVVRVPHHRAHAASAALALPSGDGAILTADGMGEWTTAASWRARAGALKRLRRAVYPHSPGKAYAAVTQWLGFRPESGEGKTMGLAAYGEPASAGAAFGRALLHADARRLLTVDERQFGFPWGESRLYGDAFLSALGRAGDGAGPERAGDADVALGIQQAVEAFAADAGQRALREADASTLAVAGGLFLNCAMNGSLLRAGIDLRPFPVAGDAGAAWGAAADVVHQQTGSRAAALGSVYLGHDLTHEEATPLAKRHGMRAHADPVELAGTVAAAIASGRIVCVARGRAEFGPRALGHRSVLASPTTLASRDRVNRLKGREAWRPVAPIIRREDTRWFHDLVPSPHMILTFAATEEARERLPGIVHVDGTARVQTVAPDEDAFLRALLDALEQRGEPPAVINTSFNRRGEPIVNTAEEAWAAYEAMGLDALVLGDWWHERASDATRAMREARAP